MVDEFETALARIAAAEERAAQAVEEARRVHMEVMKAYVGALTAMGPVGSSVAASEVADARGDEGSESGSEADEEEKSEEADEEEEGEVAGEVGDGDHEQGSAAVS
jgi:hypothetical protein